MLIGERPQLKYTHTSLLWRFWNFRIGRRLCESFFFVTAFWMVPMKLMSDVQSTRQLLCLGMNVRCMNVICIFNATLSAPKYPDRCDAIVFWKYTFLIKVMFWYVSTRVALKIQLSAMFLQCYTFPYVTAPEMSKQLSWWPHSRTFKNIFCQFRGRFSTDAGLSRRFLDDFFIGDQDSVEGIPSDQKHQL